MIDKIVNEIGPNNYFNNWYSILALAVALFIIIMSVTFLYYFFIMVPFHELGHFIFSKLSGGTIISYRIMKFTFIKIKGKIKVRIYSHQGSGGQCITCPREYTEERHPFVLEMMGGPIMDFILFITGLLVYLYIPFQTYFVSLFFLWVAGFELMNSLFNSIPMKTSGISNDGMNTLMMIKDEQAVKSWYATTHIFKQLHGGKTYKDIEEEKFLIPEGADLKNDIIAYHKLNYCYYLMDLNEWNKAYMCLEELDSRCSKFFKQKILSDKLFLLIKLGKSSEIENLYIKTKRILMQNKYDFDRIRTRMAYELYKDPSKENYNRIISEIGRIAKAYPYEGEAKFNINLIIN